MTPPPGRAPNGPAAAARQALLEGVTALGVQLSGAQLDAFDRYAELLKEGKQAFNLTALTDSVDVAVKHFVDSLSILTALPDGPLQVVDVGTGAGFPGLALKIARPELRVVMIEATGKKAQWVQQTVDRLALPGPPASALAGRAEDLARQPDFRGRFDAAVARAVAPLPVLCELCLPFVRPGGRLVAQKTVASAGTEVPAARRALDLLHAHLEAVQPVGAPGLPNRVLVVIAQDAPAPEAYPRRPGVPNKKPL